MEAPRVWYVNVYVRDLERAVAFYGETLGMELRHADRAHGYASFDAGPVGLGLEQVASGSPEAGSVGRTTGIGLGVPDLDEAHRHLSERGVRFARPPERQPWGGYLALVADPDGNLLYLDELRAE